jgi:hypothetical protein
MNPEEFLSTVDVQADPMELEMAVMHAAYLIDSRNEFENNSNLRSKEKYGAYVDMIELMVSSDIDAWCKRLRNESYWKFSNREIVNVVWNWLSGTLESPQVFESY